MTAFVIASILLESPTMATLKKRRVAFSADEKAKLPPQKDREASMLKAVVDGETWYACWTHRACHASRTFKSFMAAYPKIGSTG